MGNLNIKGIVIKSIKFSDQDKIVTVLTKERGRITMMAKGAMRPKGNLGIVTRFLSCADFTLFKGKGMYILTSADFIRNYDGIEQDMEKLTYCSHFTDMMTDAVQEGQPFPEAVEHFLYTVNKINSSTFEKFEMIRVLFELRLLFIMGYTPKLDYCSICKQKIEEKCYFSLYNDGLCCEKHKPNEAFVELNKISLDTIRYIATIQAKNLYQLNVSEEALQKLSEISYMYIMNKLDKRYTKIEMLKRL